MQNTENIEVESKILEVSHVDLEPIILKLWWKKIFDLEFLATWMINVNWKKVRIRKEGAKVVVEYKEKIWNNKAFKINKEISCSVEDFKAQISIFKEIWLKVISESTKRRVSYLLESNELWKVKLEFDEYSDLDGMRIPELLEIEAESWEVILKVAEILWFSGNDLKDWSAEELSKYYKKRQSD